MSNTALFLATEGFNEYPHIIQIMLGVLLFTLITGIIVHIIYNKYGEWK